MLARKRGRHCTRGAPMPCPEPGGGSAQNRHIAARAEVLPCGSWEVREPHEAQPLHACVRSVRSSPGAAVRWAFGPSHRKEEQSYASPGGGTPLATGPPRRPSGRSPWPSTHFQHLHRSRRKRGQAHRGLLDFGPAGRVKGCPAHRAAPLPPYIQPTEELGSMQMHPPT
jgi:hypothetical protein